MNFIQAGMLAALGALAVPIVVHLMFRRQARPVDLGTLQFLKVVLRQNTRRRKLKRYLLLSLRLACVALVAFLFARPYLLASTEGDAGRLVVVLVDRSASMGLQGGTRPIDAASAEARAVADRAGDGTRLELATFDSGVAPADKPAEAARSGFAPSAGGTDYGVALAWARDIFVRAGQTHKELHILTDLQRSGLDRGESPKIPADVEVHLSDFGRAFPKNVAVTGLEAPAQLRPRQTATVTAAVRNASPLPIAQVVVRLHLEAPDAPALDRERTLDLDGNATAIVAFGLPEMEEGLWKGYVEIQASGDDLAFDDRRFLALDVAPPPRVLLVDGDPGRSPVEAETFFLRAALGLAPPDRVDAGSPFAPQVVNASEAGSALANLDRTSAVVLANVGDLPTSESRALAGYVQKGGGLIVFGGDRLTAEGAASLVEAGLGVGKVIGPLTAQERPWRLERWEPTHPIFRPFADPEHGDLRRPAFLTVTKIEPDPSARVPAKFRDGLPAVLERTVGRGKVVWFASACDRGWGDWPRSRLYLPMAHQLVAYVSGQAEGGRVRRELAQGDRTPGLHEADGLLHVVNADPFESETARVTPREFADRFGFALPEAKTAPAAKDGVTATPDDRLRSDELWPWLALALVGLLLLEHFLANRTSA